MIIRPLFPEEFLKGYLPRTLGENVLASVDDLLRMVDDTTLEGTLGTQRFAATAKSIAKLVSVEPEHLIRHHTLVPVQRCVVNSRVQTDATGFAASRFLRLALHRGGFGRLCRICLAEDLATEGLSYWHRSHQLPGISWCMKHGCPLSEYSVEKNAYSVSPAKVIDKVHDIDADIVRRHRGNETISRYAEILSLLTRNLPRPLCVAAVAALLAKRALELNLRVGRVGKRPALSDLVAERVPVQWVKEAFNVTPKGKPDGSFADWIDQCLHIRGKPPSGYAYALSLSLLWESPEDAVAHALEEQPRTPRPVGKFVEAKIPRMVLLWLRHEASAQTIANELGLAKETVVRRLQRLGVRKLTKEQRRILSAAFGKFVQGARMSDLSITRSIRIASLERLFRIASGPLSGEHSRN